MRRELTGESGQLRSHGEQSLLEQMDRAVSEWLEAEGGLALLQDRQAGGTRQLGQAEDPADHGEGDCVGREGSDQCGGDPASQEGQALRPVASPETVHRAPVPATTPL